MSANESQVGGTHYTDMAVQPWEAMRAWMTPEQFDGYLLGNVIKYVARHPAKGGTEDLRKARHYLSRLIELRFQGDPAASKKRALEAVRENTTGLGVAIGNGTAPAVSESAARELARPDWSKAPEWAKHWYVDADLRAWWFEYPAILVNNKNWHVQKGRYDSAPIFCYAGHWMNAKSDRPAAEWPGPDWSQAPEWAVAYAIDAITSPSTKSKAHWYGQTPNTHGAASVWYFAFSSERCVFEAAPDFGYTGYWRDSLRFRPSLGEADGQ